MDKATEEALPGIPFKSIRGMRNRIAHDYGAVDFKIVWSITQQNIEPLVNTLETYFEERSSFEELQ
ncbi:MAG: HepT-like ribonuclease domain-containing protein [Verrucomicrobiota bacterium]|nr:HepT-like ribonuclease domain-containing protein [Verrucomicrobiota bacterium]